MNELKCLRYTAYNIIILSVLLTCLSSRERHVVSISSDGRGSRFSRFFFLLVTRVFHDRTILKSGLSRNNNDNNIIYIYMLYKKKNIVSLLFFFPLRLAVSGNMFSWYLGTYPGRHWVYIVRNCESRVYIVL